MWPFCGSSVKYNLYRSETAGFTPGRLARFLEKFLTEKRRFSQKTIRAAIETDLAGGSAGTRGMERQTRTQT